MIDPSTASAVSCNAVSWARSPVPLPYSAAVAAMEARVDGIIRGSASELIWLLEHEPVLTAGLRTRPEDIADPRGLDVIQTNRGGELTYHAPGQRIVYVMLDIRKRYGGDIRALVTSLQSWVIATLDGLDVPSGARDGRPGVWVGPPVLVGGEAKIAALGLRVRSGICYHGLAINVAVDLEPFSGIVACGLRQYGATSLAQLGKPMALDRFDRALLAAAPQCLSFELSGPDAPLL
jgi:lipoyl(octanoyl) transferase